MRTTVEKMEWVTKLAGHLNCKPNSVIVALILANHYNCKTGQCNPSISTISKQTNINRKTVIRAFQNLEEIGVIHREKAQGTRNSFKLIETLVTTTDTSPTSVTSPTRGTSPISDPLPVPFQTPTSPKSVQNEKPLLIDETVKETVKEKPCFSISDGNRIIGHLNSVTGSKFRLANGTKKMLQTKVKQGATVEDFITVINAKSGEWFGNPKMAMYLRPETLFGGKFDSYLAQADTPAPKSGVDEWLEEQQIQDNVIEGEFTRGR